MPTVCVFTVCVFIAHPGKEPGCSGVCVWVFITAV